MSESNLCPQCGAPLPEDGVCPACAGASTVLTPPPVLQVIGDYEVIEKLGAGGMGAVYRARQVSLGRIVALKVLPVQFAEDAEAVSRFQREAKVAASLRHANLVNVFSAGEAGGCHYIAMELIEGENLHQRMRRERLAIPEALRICADAARGLAYGWERARVVHRDIKPGNIFLSHAGEVKVGDLGLAKSLDTSTTGLTQSGTMMGTPYYMSPEQARAEKELDFRADIYSLGCTLYEALTGEPPYGGSDAMVILRQHLDSPLPPLMKKLPGCPMPLARLVGRMLKKHPRERHASYEELLAEMERVMEVLVHGESSGAGAAVAAWKELSEGPIRGADVARVAGAVKTRLPMLGAIAAGAVVLGAIAWVAMRPANPKSDTGIPARAAAEPSGRMPVSLSTATKDAPFVNTLGMKFVPVPIVGGPTDGQRVLFSVWDTRAGDYAAFATETQRAWSKPDFAQDATHPAVNVSWEDAQAFCAWLTERERKAGKLGAKEVYRLPSDHEWSCAVGIGGREDAAKLPSEKNGKIGDAFPWGSAWPPPEKAGNYAGEELRPVLAAGKYTHIKELLVGYDDGFANTSPVGSFAANRFGLYDMGGNVWQWCEDWYDASQKDRVMRGAAWNNSDRGNLLSSGRDLNAPGNRSGISGFRCVVGESAR